MEQNIGDQAFLLQEPNEDEAGDEQDQRCGVALCLVLATALRKGHLRLRPEVPVRQLLVEGLVQFRGVQRLRPGRQQALEVGDTEPARQGFERQILQDPHMPGVGLREGDILDEGDLLEHVLLGIAL